MQQITDLSDDAKQSFKVQINDGKLATFTFTFSDNQIGWYFSVEYEDFKTTGLRLVNSPNILNAYKNLIPFGVACSVTDGAEPYFQDDFTSGRVSLYILDNDDVANAETLYEEV